MKSSNFSESDIQKYILEELSKDERLKFESTMKENPEFAAEVGRQIKNAEGIAHFGAQQFKSRIKDIYSEVRPEIMSKLKGEKSSNQWLKIFLVSIALLLALFFLYRNFSAPDVISSQTIYAKHYQVYNWNPNLRSDENQSIDLGKALELYTANSYGESLPFLGKFVIANPNNIPARLAIANCHLQNSTPELAIPHLQHILTLDDVLYQDQASWYLVMAYLKIDDKKKAKGILDQLASNPSADNYKESIVILQQLR